MTDRLHTLLEDASAGAPHDPFELDSVISTGRSRVRRRRAATGLGVAAVLGLVAALGVSAGSGEDPQPAGPPQVRGLTLDDAVPAEPGRDYEVLHELTAHSSDAGMDGDFVRGVLPDGTVVVERHRGAGRQVGLVGDEGTRTVDAPRSLVNYLGSADGNPVFGADPGGLWLLDRQAMLWRSVVGGLTVDVNQTVQPVLGSDGRVVVAGPELAGSGTRELLDIDLATGTTDRIDEGGHVASRNGLTAWTDALHRPVDTVTLRDAVGQVRSFDPGTGDCVGTGIGVTSSRVVLMTSCQDLGEDDDTDVVTRIDVFDVTGDPVARIVDDDGFGPVRMSDRFLTLTEWDGERPGTYTYDLETEEFLRVTDDMSGLAGSETGSGDTLVWEERLDGDTGATYVVARMR